MRIHVELLSGVRKTFIGDSSTLAKDLNAQVTEKLEMKYTEGFGLYGEYDGERYDAMADDDHVLDFVTRFEVAERAKEQTALESKKEYVKGSFRILFMRKYLPEREKHDDEHTNILLLKQYLPQYLAGYHLVDQEMICEMAAYIWLCDYSDMNRTQISTMLPKLVPLWGLEFFDPDAIFQVVEKHKNLPLSAVRCFCLN